MSIAALISLFGCSFAIRRPQRLAMRKTPTANAVKYFGTSKLRVIEIWTSDSFAPIPLPSLRSVWQRNGGSGIRGPF